MRLSASRRSAAVRGGVAACAGAAACASTGGALPLPQAAIMKATATMALLDAAISFPSLLVIAVRASMYTGAVQRRRGTRIMKHSGVAAVAALLCASLAGAAAAQPLLPGERETNITGISGIV